MNWMARVLTTAILRRVAALFVAILLDGLVSAMLTRSRVRRIATAARKVELSRWLLAGVAHRLNV